jgi:GntR family transcriptional regulator/MocR family aminotransferase
VLYISIDKTKKRSYTEQLYGILREKILSGELSAGEPLPSSRELSRQLSIARNTVLTAYDRLVSEGAVTSIAGSGFFVSPGAKNSPGRNLIGDQQTAALTDYVIAEDTINFDSGLPALDLFPREK